MHINRLPLNSDVQDIIKSYLFYDMKTAETLKKIKTQKKEIVYMFENAAVSRKNDGLQDFEPEPSDIDSEHWVFWLGGNENQFQACNCSKCGNYSAEYAHDYVPQNILCNCGENYDDVHQVDHTPNQESEEYDQQDETSEEESYDGDEPDIDRYEYFEQYYNDSDLEDEQDPEQELEEQEARITRARMQAKQEQQEQERQEQAIEQSIQEQKEWDSETEENPTDFMRNRLIRRMAEIEIEEYYYKYFRHRYK